MDTITKKTTTTTLLILLIMLSVVTICPVSAYMHLIENEETVNITDDTKINGFTLFEPKELTPIRILNQTLNITMTITKPKTYIPIPYHSTITYYTNGTVQTRTTEIRSSNIWPPERRYDPNIIEEEQNLTFPQILSKDTYTNSTPSNREDRINLCQLNLCQPYDFNPKWYTTYITTTTYIPQTSNNYIFTNIEPEIKTPNGAITTWSKDSPNTLITSLNDWTILTQIYQPIITKNYHDKNKDIKITIPPKT